MWRSGTWRRMSIRIMTRSPIFATPGQPRATICAGVAVVPASGAGEAGTRSSGRDEGEGERLQAQGDELRADGGGGKEISSGGEGAAAGGGAGGRGGRREIRERETRGRVASGVGAAGNAAGEDSRSPGGAGARGARTSGRGEGARGVAVEGTRAARSAAGAEVRRAAAGGAGPGASEAGAASTTKLYRPGFANHEGRRDEGVCAGL